MEPIQIPEAVAAKGENMGWRHLVIDPPDGDVGSVQPVDAMVGMSMMGDGQIRPELNVLIEITEEDRANLEKGGWKFWLSFQGHIVPFSCEVFDPEDTMGPADDQSNN
jgi:hypothetical protein